MKPTREEVLREPAGHRLDRWVSEYVLGIGPRDVRVRGSDKTVRVWTDNDYFADGRCDERELAGLLEPPEYSSNLVWAFGVWARIEHPTKSLHWTKSGAERRPRVTAAVSDEPRSPFSAYPNRVEVSAGDEALAICRLAVVLALDEPETSHGAA